LRRSFGLSGVFDGRTGLTAAPGDETFSRFHVIEYDAISDHPEVIRRFPVISHV
jgi:hypothetical protein